MRRALVTLLAACSFRTTVDPQQPIDASPGMDGVVIPDAPPGAWLAGYAYRKPVVITRAGTTTLQDFPVAIVLASDGDLQAHARTDGGDIVVTSGDAMTRLDSELAAYTAASGALELWTRVPMLPPATTTIVYVYYGGPATTTNAAAVWPLSRFKGVWHLSDPASASGAADSTPAAHTLASTGTAIPMHTAGVAGLARDHDGVDDELQIADPIDGSLDVGTQSFAYSAWLRAGGAVGMFDNPFFKGGTSTSNPGYCLMTGTQNPWIGKLHDGTSYVELTLVAPTNAQWLHVAVVVDRAANPDRALSYVNGVQTDAEDITLGSLSTAREFSLGAGSGGARYRGLVDEARIYNTALTADWIATEYANLATPGFLTKGAEETQP